MTSFCWRWEIGISETEQPPCHEGWDAELGRVTA